MSDRLEYLRNERAAELKRAEHAREIHAPEGERGARCSAAWLAKEIEKEENPNPPKFWRPGHP